MRWWPLLLLMALLQPPSSLTAQQRIAPTLSVDQTGTFRPVLALGTLLDDRELTEAVHSGLPVRLRVRVELWRDRLIDEIAAAQSWNAVLLFDPLDRHYTVRTRGSGASQRIFESLDAARHALEGPPTLVLRPRASGTYYYTANIEVETLSLSDLEELERWLQGEVQPAVSGKQSVPEAIGEGAKRLLIRVLGLPTRTVDLKTSRFKVPTS